MVETVCNISLKVQVTLYKKEHKKYPGDVSMENWRRRLAMAPEDVVRRTFESTTQMAMNVEAENRTSGRRHYRSRFPFLKEKRVNDVGGEKGGGEAKAQANQKA